MPYVAAGIVLAGFGAYLMKGKISKLFQKDNAPIKNMYKEMKDKVEIGKAEIVAKIERIKNEQNEAVNNIIHENIKDGHVDLPKMRKIAGDFANDLNKGDDRFHQAADILEQSYIREFVKGNADKKEGLQNFFDFANGDGALFNIYTKMPMDEAANRLHCLKTNDFKSAQHNGMDAEQFFKTALQCPPIFQNLKKSF